MSNIVFKNKNLIIAYKPAGVPSQSDKSGDDDIMSIISSELKNQGEDGTLYPVHRLDRVVGGLIVFARNHSYAGALSSLVSDDTFGKEYVAVVEGVAQGGEMRDYLHKDAMIGKSIVVNKGTSGAKEAVLNYKVLGTGLFSGKPLSFVKIKLNTGRFHQIRSQFASRGMPLIGDVKYGSKIRKSKTPALFSYKMDFEINGERFSATKMPDFSDFPWNIFSETTCYDSEN